MGVPAGFQGEQERSSVRDGCCGTQLGIVPQRETEEGSVSEILFTKLHIWLNFNCFLDGKLKKKDPGLITPASLPPAGSVTLCGQSPTHAPGKPGL